MMKNSDNSQEVVLESQEKKDANLSKGLYKKQELSIKSNVRMLTNTSRNSYTLNQMVDRKARVILSLNALILSLIIGKIIVNKDILDLKLILFIISGSTSLISIIYAMLAMRPEKINANLSVEKIQNMKGNPLYYGNFIKMSADDYEDAIFAMGQNPEFVQRALIQDIYYSGLLLASKKKNLRNALYVLCIGIFLALLLAVSFRFLYE